MTSESRSGPVYSIISLVLRLGLGGLFLFAAYNKLIDPQTFSESVQAFHMPLPDWMVLLATYAIPWTEIFCSVALVMGLWSRAAGMVFLLLMSVFLIGIISAILRHLPLNCGCFGKFKLYCDGPLGWCKVRENCVLAAGATIIVIGGGGRFALDWPFSSRSTQGTR